MADMEPPIEVKIDHRGFFMAEYSHPGKYDREWTNSQIYKWSHTSIYKMTIYSLYAFAVYLWN